MKPLLASPLLLLGSSLAAQAPAVLDAEATERFAALALGCVHREYPNKISHVLSGAADVRSPRELTPAFYGCFDWHSAVHGHWLLARLARLFPDAAYAGPARAALAETLTPEHIASEVRYLEGQGRASFERPYGLAWLLQLSAELHEWDDARAREWAAALEPLERAVADRFATWLPKLSHPMRTGEHSQTAFALGLVLDWARSRRDERLATIVVARARAFYLEDRSWSFAFEPGGEDFLSPGLAEADLMRRILEPGEFAKWLYAFLPQVNVDSSSTWLTPAVVTDRSDGKLVHLDGLNLARAWMIEGVLAGLPQTDPRRPGLQALAGAHREAGLAAIADQHYEGGHWLGTFAVYLVTGRGLAGR